MSGSNQLRDTPRPTHKPKPPRPVDRKEPAVSDPPFLAELKKTAGRPKPVKEVYQEEELPSDVDVDDDDDECDSDLDFIDDSEAPDAANKELSETLREVFGYDKSKYKDDRFDNTRDMEASFRDIMKEEARTSRLGRLEDLEDLKREMKEEK